MSFQLCLLFSVTLLSAVHNVNSKASHDIPKNSEKLKFLINSSTNMQFQKITDWEGSVDLIYDCSLGIYDEGIVDVYDRFHPENTRSISIENCENITLRICPNDVGDNWMKFSYLKELLVKNINTLTFFTGCQNSHNREMNYDYVYRTHYGPETTLFKGLIKNPKRFRISNVKNLELLNYSCSYFPNVLLIIENTTIGELYAKAISSGVATLQLQNVKINTFKENGIYLNYDHKYFDPVLIIKDCHFGNVDSKVIFVNGSEVEISNNSFQYLQDDAFTINASNKFNFSDNYIRKMEAPFDVWGSNIHITGNTFDIIKNPWIAGLRVKSGQNHGVFNVSQNSMKIYPLHYFAMDPTSTPDVTTFQHNNFNCSCQYQMLNECEYSKVSAYLVEKSSNNVCANLGNCPLSQALKHMDEICQETFNCSEAEKPKLSTETYLEMILFSLKDIQATLHSLASKDKPLTFSNEIGKPGGELIATEHDGLAP